MNSTTRRTLVTLLAGGLLLTAGTAGVAAHGDGGATDAVHVLDEELKITDVTVTISDTSLTVPGVGTHDVEHRTFTIAESSVTVGRFQVTVNGRDFVVGPVQITFQDVSLVLDDVHVNGS